MAILAMRERGQACPPQIYSMAILAITPSRTGCPCHAADGMAIVAMRAARDGSRHPVLPLRPRLFPVGFKVESKVQEPMSTQFQLYYITDRSQLKSLPLEDCMATAIHAGVDWVQIREKDLPARRLLALAESALESARPAGGTRVMVNDRLDVARAAGAHGVHLGARSLPAEVARQIVPREFVVGVSCHSLEEARAAQAAGADYVLLGPVFATPSKLAYGAPLGLARLREVTAQVSIPVIALGGITADRVALCRENGAAGIAGIRIFQDCDSMEELVRSLRQIAAG